MHPSQLTKKSRIAFSKASTQQRIVLPENPFSLLPRQNEDNEFKKKVVEQLHLRSLYLVNTKQYAEFNDKIS